MNDDDQRRAQALAELDAAESDYLVWIRGANGTSAARFHRLCEALELCAREWRGSSEIPRGLAQLIVGIGYDVDGQAEAYINDPDIRTELHRQAFILQGLAVEVVDD